MTQETTISTSLDVYSISQVIPIIPNVFLMYHNLPPMFKQKSYSFPCCDFIDPTPPWSGPGRCESRRTYLSFISLASIAVFDPVTQKKDSVD